MAEGNSNNTGRETLPQRGKVDKVCKQWLVHEDGALAYQLQNKEIDRHYGLNRYNRRTIRDDIPVARVVQTDEEVRQQEERFHELEALKAQAEEDEEIARRVTEELLNEDEAHKKQREIEDEEIARTVQEKEKVKYEKYMEKKRRKELKKEREILERQLEQHTQDARLNVRSSQDGGTVDEDMGEVQNSFGDMAVSGRNSRSARNGYNTRVTPSGRIEDEGDFTDFFAVPDDIPEAQRSRLQHLQDEELARLLQEQEHKRTKAQVDRVKLREIEEQDERLAKIIQEQETLRAKRAKEKRKQQEEVKRQQQNQMTNPATRPLPDLPGKRISSDPPVNKSHDHHRLRRDSFIQSIENRSSQQPQSPESEQSTTSSRNSHRQTSRKHSADPNNRPRLPTPEKIPPHAPQSVEQWVINSVREMQNHQQDKRRVPSNPSDEMIPSPSPPGSYHSEDELPYRPPQPKSNSRTHNNHHHNHTTDPCYAVSNPISFNIAAAIDPTYRQPSNGTHNQNDETEQKIPMVSSSMPIPEEFDLEWDPSLRGSLRRPKGSWNPLAANYFHDQMSGRSDNFSDDGPVISPFQPVQGQRRSTLDKPKSRKSTVGNSKKDKQGNCKQQ